MRRSLTKSEIVRSSAEIDRLFRTGRRYNGSGLKLIAAPNGLDYSRLIVIPVRHFGNSVQRNLARRQYKELFRTNKDRIRSGFDLAFIVYKGQTASYGEKELILISLLSQAGLWTA
ncbi:MAG: ribonuclease P protein component [Spirochaetales bacterium]|nr:ribonuclease P protein component [Spirochaetales bacterium]